MSNISGDGGSFHSGKNTGEDEGHHHHPLLHQSSAIGPEANPPPPAAKKKRSLPGTPGGYISYFILTICLMLKSDNLV